MAHYPVDKIHDLDSLKKQVKGWKSKGMKVVFTNGCFDLLHQGHVQYLSQAAAQGDRLIVAVNSDRSVKALEKKGDRPINKENARAFVIAAIGIVDAVIIFDEDTPQELIQNLLPDVLVKGGDWKEKDIVGGEVVRQKGGKVLSLPLLEGFSTTSIIERIKAS